MINTLIPHHTESELSDLIPVTEPHSSLRATQASTSPAHKKARYLVAEYLHDWGLRDPEVVAEESRRIVDLALLESFKFAPDERELCEIAIEMTQSEVETSIATMAATSRTILRKQAATTNSIVPRMGRVLLEFPDAIRHRDRPPARLLQVLEKSVNPIVPCCNRCDMLPQPRTRLWKPLRKGYWFRVQRRITKFMRRCVGIW